MTDPIDAAGNPIVPPVPDAGATGGLPDEAIKKAQAETAEWQKRFGGLQGKYQQEQEKWATTAAQLLTVDEANKKLTADYEALKTLHATVDEEKDTYFTDLELTKAQLERLSIVTMEFPHLLPLLGSKPEEDTLPDGTGDELRAKLKVMSEKIESIKKGAVDANILGASPDNPPSSLKGDEGLRKQMFTAMREGRMDDYNKLYAQIVEKSSPKGG
jgi:hypothetical protein